MIDVLPNTRIGECRHGFEEHALVDPYDSLDDFGAIEPQRRGVAQGGDGHRQLVERSNRKLYRLQIVTGPPLFHLVRYHHKGGKASAKSCLPRQFPTFPSRRLDAPGDAPV
jgi:hypothetical protein